MKNIINLVRTNGNDVQVKRVTNQLVNLCYGNNIVEIRTEDSVETIFNLFIDFVKTQGCNRSVNNIIFRDFVNFSKDENIKIIPMSMTKVA